MENVYQSDMTGKRQLSRVKRAIVVLLLTVAMLGAAVYGGLYILLKGPSPYAGALFVDRVKDTPVISDVVRLIAGESAFVFETGPQEYNIYPQIE